MSELFLICDQCGTENPPGSLFCLICGHDLSLPKSSHYDVDDGEINSDNLPINEENDLPELLRDLHDENPTGSIRRSALFTQDDAEKTHAVKIRHDEGDHQDWMERVRKKAQEDGITEANPEPPTEQSENLEAKTPESPKSDEHGEWLDKVKQTANRDGLHNPPLFDNSATANDNVPEWLKKVREQLDAEREDIPNEDETPEKPDRPFADWIKEEIHKDLEPLTHTDATQPVKIEEPESEETVSEEEKQIAEPIVTTDEKNAELPGTMAEVTPQDAIEEKIPESQIEAFWREFDRNPAEEILKEQLTRADLIKSLLTTEGKSVEIPSPIEKKKTRWLRFFLALILLGAVIAPLFLTTGRLTHSGSLSPAGQAFFDHIDQLAADARVLVVLDYAAGLSAEMESVSQPVFGHLTQKNTNISLLAIQPEGNWLSQHLLEHMQTTMSTESVINLGYLPGNRLGLINLSINSADTLPIILPLLPDQTRGSNLSDFDCLILLTDSLQTTRNWVELVSPVVVHMPVLVISSTQEVLMVIPYFDSNQVDGVMAGMQEAYLYAAALGNSNQQPASWRSYQSGLLVMAGLMLVGIVIRLEAISSENELREIEP